MWKWLTWVLTLAVAQATEAPFWRSKEKVYARIRNREIVVSVVHHSAASGVAHNSLVVSGGGQSSSSCAVIFAQALRPQELVEASDYIKSSTFDPASSSVTVKIEALGHAAELTVKLKPFAEAAPRRLEFEIVRGSMSGFHGTLTFTDLNVRACEIGLAANYSYDQAPLPRSFLEFGLEVIFQRMATRLRAFVEGKDKVVSQAPSSEGQKK